MLNNCDISAASNSCC